MIYIDQLVFITFPLIFKQYTLPVTQPPRFPQHEVPDPSPGKTALIYSFGVIGEHVL